MELINMIVEFVPETITLMFWLLFLSSSGLIFYWIKNRNKYLNYSHEIPESLIRDYKDTLDGNRLAQGSDILSESKFASVVKADELSNSAPSISIITEQMQKLSAEISELKSSLQNREEVITQLEKKVPVDLDSNVSKDGMTDEELDKLREDNEELRNKLKEFELVEDDLVMLRDLKIENNDLKKKLNIGEIIEEETEVVSGAPEEVDDLIFIKGEKVQKDTVTIIPGEKAGERPQNGEGTDELSKEKKDLNLGDEKRSFGSVKVKGGNIFGKSASDSETVKNKSLVEEVDESVMSITEEIEAVADLGDGAKANVASDELSDIEKKIDETENNNKQVSDVSVENDGEADEEEVDSNLVSMKSEQEGEESENDKDKSSSPQNDKSAEELLDEFEKMLG